MSEYIPSQGLVPDKVDARDFLVSDVLGVPMVDWDAGFDAYKASDLAVPAPDQGSSLSCVGQGIAQYTRVVHKILSAKGKVFSPKFLYSQIALPQGGASLRDGMKLASSAGVALEDSVPSYEKGNPPSEPFMRDLTWKNDDIFEKAKVYDQFSYRVILGGTSDIDIFANAIQQFGGVLLGFTGTNPGWTQDMVRPPQNGEDKWGHAVYGAGFGMYKGKRCLFTPNSWGNRYGIKEGLWAGFQAIPEDYFTAGEMTAVGDVKGIYVFNSWAFVPDDVLPGNQKVMDTLKRLEGQPVMDSASGRSGSIAWVKNGKLKVVSKERKADFACNFLVEKFGTGLPPEIWDAAEKEQF